MVHYMLMHCTLMSVDFTTAVENDGVINSPERLYIDTTKSTNTKTLWLKLTAKLLFSGRRAFMDNTSEVITEGPI